VAFVGLLVLVLEWLGGASHSVDESDIFGFFFTALSRGLLLAGVLWLLYIGLEPYVRRRWPEMLVSWSRLLTGGIRDPLVGRDVLVGLLFGAIASAVSMSESLMRSSLGAIPPSIASVSSWSDLHRFTAHGLLGNINNGILISLFMLLMIFILRVVTRRQWLTAILFVLIFATPASLGDPIPLIHIPVLIFVNALWTIAFLRFGLLAVAVMIFVLESLIDVPITTDLHIWYSGMCFFSLVFFVALAAYGFYISLGGQKLFEGKLLDDPT